MHAVHVRYGDSPSMMQPNGLWLIALGLQNERGDTECRSGSFGLKPNKGLISAWRWRSLNKTIGTSQEMQSNTEN